MEVLYTLSRFEKTSERFFNLSIILGLRIGLTLITTSALHGSLSSLKVKVTMMMMMMMMSLICFILSYQTILHYLHEA